jgi:hypothetical protein
MILDFEMMVDGFILRDLDNFFIFINLFKFILKMINGKKILFLFIFKIEEFVFVFFLYGLEFC